MLKFFCIIGFLAMNTALLGLITVGTYPALNDFLQKSMPFMFGLVVITGVFCLIKEL